ncbi:hypothetical protein AAHE18_11G170500 [Arachis hypogaea]
MPSIKFVLETESTTPETEVGESQPCLKESKGESCHWREREGESCRRREREGESPLRMRMRKESRRRVKVRVREGERRTLFQSVKVRLRVGFLFLIFEFCILYCIHI